MPNPPPASSGVLVFVVSCLLYNLALWEVVQILNVAGAIDWELRWVESGLLTLIVMAWRRWDRVLFQKREG